jgi:hypothetical protein
MAKVPPAMHTLVLMHDPASLFELPPVRGLVVAAIRMAARSICPASVHRSSRVRRRAWAYGWIEHGDNRMYVTSGLGVSILPVRFNMRPDG